jgi:lipid-binding SYLF domain-containing protein
LIFFIWELIFLNTIFLQALPAEVERNEAKLLLASSVLEEINQAPDQAIPFNLLQDCSAVGVFPSLKKGGYIVGAQFGKGVFTHRDPKSGKWSPPVFFKIMGASFGLQFGFEEVDLVLIFTSDRAFQNVLERGVTVGVSLAATAGPVGRDTSRSNSLSDRDAIYAYSRSQGLFAGATLSGTQIAYDYDATKEFYGDAYSAEMILLENQIPPAKVPKLAAHFLETLLKYTNT